jgi:hypothetical protein
MRLAPKSQPSTSQDTYNILEYLCIPQPLNNCTLYTQEQMNEMYKATEYVISLRSVKRWMKRLGSMSF